MTIKHKILFISIIMIFISFIQDVRSSVAAGPVGCLIMHLPPLFVIPAKAGIQKISGSVDSRLRGNDAPELFSGGLPEDVDHLICESLKRFQQISDYTCTLEKKVKKDGVVYYDPEIMVKFKKPALYYFKWGRGRFEGQEVIYAEGSNRDTIVAHSGGLFRFITLHLDPEGSIAMKRNHHPLKRSGLVKVYDILGDSYQRHKKTGDGKIELTGGDRIDNREIWRVEGEFPQDKGFYAARIFLYLDKELLLPLKVTVHDWSGVLYEEYTFHDLKINVGLDEKDFDPENSEYNFK